MTSPTHQQPPTGDPFSGGESRPSVSFKDAPHGTTVTGRVIDLPTFVQSRDFETGDLKYWPDGNPQWSVVTGLEVNGEEMSLWASKPSSMFAAIAKAQQEAGAQIALGGTLTITYTHDKPNEKNPRLNAAKQYTASYAPPNAFVIDDGQQVDTRTGEVTPPQPAAMPAQPPQAAPPAPAPAAQPAAGAPTVVEQIKQLHAAGLTAAQIKAALGDNPAVNDQVIAAVTAA